MFWERLMPRVARAMGGVLVSIGVALVGCATVDIPGPPPGGSGVVTMPPPIPSTIAVPFTAPLGLTELERIANELVPAGQPPGAGEGAWRDVDIGQGARLRVAFWRDGVQMTTDGSRVQTIIRLYFRLAVQPGGAGGVIACGSATAPGVAVLPLVTTFAWHPEWRLVPTTTAGV